MKPDIQLGYYRHYKGNVYQVFDLALYTETDEWLVLYGKERIEYARPFTEFIGFVTVNGAHVPRFAFENTHSQK